MRLISWALTDDGFDVQTLSKRDALELRGLSNFDVAVFNMSATSEQKMAYNEQLRMLNPNALIIDVDQFGTGGGSVRDSRADGYTARPLNLEALIDTIREKIDQTVGERQQLRDDHDDAVREARRDAERARSEPRDGRARDS
jgi:hypothetical protein